MHFTDDKDDTILSKSLSNKNKSTVVGLYMMYFSQFVLIGTIKPDKYQVDLTCRITNTNVLNQIQFKVTK